MNIKKKQKALVEELAQRIVEWISNDGKGNTNEDLLACIQDVKEVLS